MTSSQSRMRHLRGPRHTRRKLQGVLVVLAVAMVLLAGCGSSDNSDAGSDFAAKEDSSLNKMLPAVIRDRGTLRVLVDAESGPPMAFIGEDGTTVEGLESDLIHAAADVLGLKVEETQGKFDSLVPGIQADRGDVAYGSIGDLKERVKVVDFVDYAEAGTAIMVPAGNPDGIDGLKTLCGHAVAVNKGTYQEDQILKQNDKCKADGEEPAHLSSFGSSSAAQLALRSGRVDAWLGDSAPVGYAAKQSNGEFELAGSQPPIAYLGYVVNKDQPKLRDALQAALEKLLKDGTYDEIFQKWGQESTELTKITVNNALL